MQQVEILPAGEQKRLKYLSIYLELIEDCQNRIRSEYKYFNRQDLAPRYKELGIWLHARMIKNIGLTTNR